MKILVLCGMMIALLAASFHLLALDRVERFVGVVTATSANSITLASSEDDARDIRIAVQRSTLFLQDGKSVSLSDLKIGTRADVDAATDGEVAYAINIAFEGPSGSRGAEDFSAPAQRRE